MQAVTEPRQKRAASALLLGLVVLGIALLVANIPGSPLRSADTNLFTIFALPAVISLGAYVRFAEPVVWWEIALLAVWGAVGIAVTTFIAFLATMGTPASSAPVAELTWSLALFLAATVGLGVPYALAGTFRHDHPRRAVASGLLGPVAHFLLFTTTAVAL